mmetsp:Transcript_10073/g.24039  ORF Transcript_10073/g.24039 Transcript_10073/m.24039 type:complete len:90 (+) Transcript_10073:621-890(+)
MVRLIIIIVGGSNDEDSRSKMMIPRRSNWIALYMPGRPFSDIYDDETRYGIINRRRALNTIRDTLPHLTKLRNGVGHHNLGPGNRHSFI